MVSKSKVHFVAFVLIALFASGAWATETMRGAGSTFIDPILAKWIDAYSKVDPSVQINYESIGSLQGIDKLLSHSAYFAASDAPLQLTQLDQPACETLFFPATLGAIVAIYNLPEVSATTRIKFTGSLLADVFLGKIQKWNDPAIAAVNPGIELPDRDILVTYRQDGSGTTYTFTDYLAKVSADWEKGPGRGMLVRWPVGLHAPGNEGVAEAVKSQPGAIGYVELTYAVNNDLRFAQIQNRNGNWVEANPESMTAAAGSLIGQMPSDLKESITDAPGSNAYPICSYSYLLVFKHQTDAGKVEAFSKFVSWILHDGQSYAGELHYGAVPASLLATANDQLKQVQTTAVGSSVESCKATLGVAPHQTAPLVIRHEEEEAPLSSD